MKKFFISMVLFLVSLALSSMGFAYLKGDINDDNRIGLPEAIYALQVTSGLQAATPTNTINVPAEFATIQAAIDAAKEGDAINVSAGTYPEALTIRKPITIRGAGKDVSIINGNSLDTITIDGVKVVIISGLTLQQGKNGIYAMRGAIVEVSDAVVKDMAAKGFDIRETSTARLTNVTVQKSGDHGIRAFNGSGISFHGTVVSSENKKDGIVIGNSSNAYFATGVNVTSNNNVGKGINIYGSSGLLAEGATITVQNNQAHGLQCYAGCSILLLTNSSVLSENNTSNGFYIGLSAGLNTDASSSLTIRNSKGSGLSAVQSASVQIYGTLLTEQNASNGIHIGMSANVYTYGSVTSQNNTSQGIFLYDNGALYVQGPLSVINNTGNGINILRGSQASLFPISPSTVVVSNNGGSGIYAQNGNLTAYGASLITITGNGGGDVYLWFGSKGQLYGTVGTKSCDETSLILGLICPTQ